MKKLFRYFLTLVVLLGISGGQFVYAYDADGNANYKREIAGAPGSLAYREYQLVRWGENGPSPTGGNLSAGDVVVADCVSDDGITIAIIGSTNSVDAVKGVVVSALIQSVDVTGTTAITDFGRRNWGYIQVKGLCTKVNMFNSGPAGSSVVAVAQVRCAGSPNSASAAPRTLGFALDASEAGQGGGGNDVDIEV